MLTLESKVLAADNAGAISFKCITIYGGFRRRYARLGEMVGTVSHLRRVYSSHINKKILARKVKKKRKQKSKKIKPYVRPYLSLLVGLKRSSNRKDGSYIKFDENRSLTFSEPTKYGPAGKSTMVPNFLGTRIFGPICRELRYTKWLNEKYRSVISKSKGVV
jgi:large subunit ribosomal protein L14